MFTNMVPKTPIILKGTDTLKGLPEMLSFKIKNITKLIVTNLFFSFDYLFLINHVISPAFSMDNSIELCPEGS